MNFHYSPKKSILVLLAIAASSSTAISSFGTEPGINSARIRAQRIGTRGGSDQASIELSVSDPTSYQEGEETSKNDSALTLNHMGPKSTPPGLLRSKIPQFPWHRLPDWLTYARCIAIPGLVLQFYLSTSPNKNIHSSIIFALASITDWLDGYLARRWDITSAFGAFLDPVADKLMVSTGLILLAGKYGPIVALPSAIILAREIAVSALREWMASRGLRESVKVGFQGKVKTAATMVALTIVLAVPDGWDAGRLFFWLSKAGTWDVVMSVGMGLFYLSSIVTVTSGSVYFKAAAPVLFGS